MKNTVILCLGLSLSGVSYAQELPEAPVANTEALNLTKASTLGSRVAALGSPFNLKGETSFYKALYSTDALLRVGDAITTHRLLADPCHCFREADPLAPKSSNPVLGALFQASALMAVTQAHNILMAHGHKKWARAVLWADLGSEAFAVAHNASLTPPTSRSSISSSKPLTYKPLN